MPADTDRVRRMTAGNGRTSAHASTVIVRATADVTTHDGDARATVWLTPSPSTHGGVTITTNTASEADLRTEMEAPPAAAAAPREPPAATPATPPPPVRDAKGRFAKTEAPDAARRGAGTPSRTDRRPSRPRAAATTRCRATTRSRA